MSILLAGFGDLTVLQREFEESFPDFPELFVQPVLLLKAFEYEKLRRRYAFIGRPLLSSREDVLFLANILREKYRDATLFVGHGTEHSADRFYAELAEILPENAFVGTLTGALNFEIVKRRIMSGGVKELSVVPLTLGTGKHVQKEILGDWSNNLEESGITVSRVNLGLLDYAEVRRKFISNAASDIDNIARSHTFAPN
ncbi:hypothetical protein AGMMS49975_12250 [Clostridia bacterium]|nr:hypothetical protein AGMMS49975_12250 [Clostridia bacterium]